MDGQQTQLDRIERELAEVKGLLLALTDSMSDELETEDAPAVEVVTMDGKRHRVPSSPLGTL